MQKDFVGQQDLYFESIVRTELFDKDLEMIEKGLVEKTDLYFESVVKTKNKVECKKTLLEKQDLQFESIVKTKTKSNAKRPGWINGLVFRRIS